MLLLNYVSLVHDPEKKIDPFFDIKLLKYQKMVSRIFISAAWFLISASFGCGRVSSLFGYVSVFLKEKNLSDGYHLKVSY